MTRPRHAAQGVSAERAFVLLPDQGALREWGYVACSHARAQTHLYLAERAAIERETRSANTTQPVRCNAPRGPSNARPPSRLRATR